MGRVLVVLALALSAAEAQAESDPRWPVALQTEVVATYRRGFEGEIHLWVKDLETQVRYAHNAATPTYLASVVKVLFMIELFHQLERGELSLDEEMEFTESDLRGGSPLFNYLGVGARLPLSVLLEAMIQQSDNTASDMIARRVGIERVNQGLLERGYAGFGQITPLLDVRRRVYERVDARAAQLTVADYRALDFAQSTEARAAKLNKLLLLPAGAHTATDVDRAYAAYYATGANSAPMELVGRLLEDLAVGRVVSSTASRAMVSLLLGTQTGENRISARLPADLRIAHKTGTQHRRTCDVGIMYRPRPLVFAACVKGSTSAKRDDVIARLAAKTHELVGAPKDLPIAGRKPRPGPRERTAPAVPGS